MALQMTKIFDTLNFSFGEPVKEAPCKKAKPAVFEFTIEDKKDADHIINTFLKSIGL